MKFVDVYALFALVFAVALIVVGTFVPGTALAAAAGLVVLAFGGFLALFATLRDQPGDWPTVERTKPDDDEEGHRGAF